MSVQSNSYLFGTTRVQLLQSNRNFLLNGANALRGALLPLLLLIGHTSELVVGSLDFLKFLRVTAAVGVVGHGKSPIRSLDILLTGPLGYAQDWRRKKREK